MPEDATATFHIQSSIPQLAVLIAFAIILTGLFVTSGCAKNKDGGTMPSNKGGIIVAEVIDSDSPPDQKERPLDLDESQLEKILLKHKAWLSYAGLGFVLGTNESSQQLQQMDKHESLGSTAATDMQFSFSITRDGKEYKWTVLKGANLAVLCDHVAETLKKNNNIIGSRVSGSITATEKSSFPREANLICADLRDSYFSDQVMQGATLTGADLRNAHFFKTDLSNVNLRGADLRGAQFVQCNLTGAIISEADLRGASFRAGTIMNSVNADSARFEEVQFDPKDLSNLSVIGARGLSEVVFLQPYAAVKLRTQVKEAGLKGEERELTSAIHKWQASDTSRIDRFFDGYVAGGKLTNYGTNPWRSIIAMLLLIPVFALAYIASLEFYSTKLVVKLTDRKGRERSIRWRREIHATVRQDRWRVRLLGWISTQARIIRIGFYLSFLTAFRFGWHELNVGSWISGLQFHDYELRPSGWLRMIAGIQSVSSLYLLALWAIILFSNPF